MSNKVFNTTMRLFFNSSLTQGDLIIFNLALIGTGPQNGNNHTASLSQGSLSIQSSAITTGYNTTDCPYLTPAAWGAGTVDTLVFNTSVSGYYGDDYLFAPNPLTGSAASSLYQQYGDPLFSFKPELYDIVIMQLSDSSYFSAEILNVYKDSAGRLTLQLNAGLPELAKQDISATIQNYKVFLLLKRYPDEQNVILRFPKAPGETSYGFVIPNTISTSVVDNMNTLQAAVQKQLLSTQANTGGA